MQITSKIFQIEMLQNIQIFSHWNTSAGLNSEAQIQVSLK